MKKDLFLSATGFQEEVIKKVSPVDEERKLAYVFNDVGDLYNYFLENDIPEKYVGLSNSTVLGILEDGRVIADKSLCDGMISIVSKHEKEKLKMPQKIKINK